LIHYQIDFKPVPNVCHFTIDFLAPFISKKNSLQRVTLHPQIGSSRTDHVMHNNFVANFGDQIFRDRNDPNVYYLTVHASHCGHNLVKVVIEEEQAALPRDLMMPAEK
jgi:hypothetical protein